MPRRKYADDYEIVTTTDEKGREKRETVYRGEFYEVSLDEQGLLHYKRICFILLGIIIVLHAGAGFFNNPGMYQFYVAIPYTAAFFPMLYTAEGVLRLPREKRPYRRDEVGHSFNRIQIAGSILLGFLAITVLGEIAFLVFQSGSSFIGEYFFFIPEFLAMAAAIALQVFRKRSKIQHLKGGE